MAKKQRTTEVCAIRILVVLHLKRWISIPRGFLKSEAPDRGRGNQFVHYKEQTTVSATLSLKRVEWSPVDFRHFLFRLICVHALYWVLTFIWSSFVEWQNYGCFLHYLTFGAVLVKNREAFIWIICICCQALQDRHKLGRNFSETWLNLYWNIDIGTNTTVTVMLNVAKLVLTYISF